MHEIGMHASVCCTAQASYVIGVQAVPQGGCLLGVWPEGQWGACGGHPGSRLPHACWQWAPLVSPGQVTQCTCHTAHLPPSLPAPSLTSMQAQST